MPAERASLAPMKLSDEAKRILKALGAAYAKAGHPAIHSWAFSADNAGERSAYGELAALGLFKEFTLNGEYVFTDSGVREALDMQ